MALNPKFERQQFGTAGVEGVKNSIPKRALALSKLHFSVGAKQPDCGLWVPRATTTQWTGTHAAFTACVIAASVDDL